MKLLYLQRRVKVHRLLCANQPGRRDVFWKWSFCVFAWAAALQRERHRCAGWLLQLSSQLCLAVFAQLGGCWEARGKQIGALAGLPVVRRILDETQDSSCSEKGRNLPCAFCVKKGGCDGRWQLFLAVSSLDAALCWRWKWRIRVVIQALMMWTSCSARKDAAVSHRAFHKPCRNNCDCSWHE